MFDIKGKVAIVTGAANGIGLETTKALLAKGAFVLMTDINKELLVHECTKLTNEYPMQVTCEMADVSDEYLVEHIVSKAVATFGHLDIMVANAGVGFGGSTHEDDTRNYHKLIDVNQHGVFYCDKYAIKQMVAQGGNGAVVNISSIEGIIGEAGLAYYNTSKWAVRGLTKSLALEYAPHNIRVNSVHPGYIITGMVNEDTMGEAGLEYLKAKHPITKGIGRLGAPEEIAHAVVFAIENTFMTGTEIIIDGGYTAQ